MLWRGFELRPCCRPGASTDRPGATFPQGGAVPGFLIHVRHHGVSPLGGPMGLHSLVQGFGLGSASEHSGPLPMASVRKREWTSPKGEAKSAWVVDYLDQAGKRRLETFARKKQADAYVATAVVEVRTGVHTADSQSITVAQAAELWIGSCAAMERTTVDSYRSHVELHIKPYLGRTKISQITAPMVREFEDRLRKGESAPGQDTAEKRSPAMVKRIIGSLGFMLADSQERGLVARNVVRDLRGSRKKGKERHAERRQKGRLKVGVDIPMPAEIRSIVMALNAKWRPILLTAIFTGLRASELRGLRWTDLDLDRRELHVRQRADRYNMIGPPKTAAGERVIPIPPALVAALATWRDMAPASALGLAFPTGRGGIEHYPNLVNRAFRPAQVAAGVTVVDEGGVPVAKYPGLHNLRHFYASWCINRRVDGGLELPAKIVQERLGHSTIAMTLDTYGHLFPRGDDGSELEAAERALLG